MTSSKSLRIRKLITMALRRKVDVATLRKEELMTLTYLAMIKIILSKRAFSPRSLLILTSCLQKSLCLEKLPIEESLSTFNLWHKLTAPLVKLLRLSRCGTNRLSPFSSRKLSPKAYRKEKRFTFWKKKRRNWESKETLKRLRSSWHRELRELYIRLWEECSPSQSKDWTSLRL